MPHRWDLQGVAHELCTESSFTDLQLSIPEQFGDCFQQLFRPFGFTSSIPFSTRVDTKIGFAGAYAAAFSMVMRPLFNVELPVLGVPARQVSVPPFNVITVFPPPVSTPLDFASIFFLLRL